MAMEHRWSERCNFSGRARIEFARGGVADTWMCDLSLGGVGLVSRGWSACGMSVQVSLSFGDPGGMMHACRLRGEVVHETAGRLGVAFLDASPETMRTLRAVMENSTHRSSRSQVDAVPANVGEAK